MTDMQDYRYYLIWRIPSLHDLDFARVRDAEREHANELFGTLEEPTALATKIMGIKSAAPSAATQMANGAATSKRQKVAMTAKEKKRVKEMIMNAKSLPEVTRLQKMLDEGRIPGGVLGDEE
jgi:U2 small nuclear ribonucleoprotein A'